MIDRVKSQIKDKHPYLVPLLRAGMAVVLHPFSRRRIRRIVKGKKEIFLELGAGDKKGAGGWITLDISRKCDIFWDLAYGLPFPDESIAKIYSSHVFEHFSFTDGQKLFDECRRVLVKGGIFSICVPNARFFIEAYMKSGSPIESIFTSDTPDQNNFFILWKAYNATTKIDYVNYTAYMDGLHKYMFDEENIIYILKSKGFKNARLRQFDPNLDHKMRDFESIYAEAEK